MRQLKTRGNGNRPPLHRITKAQIVWMANHRCRHGHTYLEHYACYQPSAERVGFLDIETSNLDADFGIMLSWCIKEADTETIHEGVLAAKDAARKGEEDTRVVASCLAALQKFDKIITYYGKRFDVPFIRTRALVCGLPFPNYGTLTHVDLYDVIRHRFRISSRRLENACRVLLGDTKKTRVDAKYWRAALRGDREALGYILDHNRRDVLDLERLYHKTINFVRKSDTSI